MATKDDETIALVKEYIAQGEDSLSIVIAGKMGTGKSSLVNGIVGEKVAEEGSSAISVTSQIKHYEAEIKTSEEKTVSVTVWDTPGLGDAFGDDEQVVSEVAQKCKKTDLLLYCLDMRQRLTIDDVNGITLLTKHLGPELWKNAVFALTFANKLKKPPDSDREPVEIFKEKFTSWRDAITRLLNTKLSVPSEIVDDIAIVPTGYRKCCPPDRSDWFTPFWLEAFRKMRESAQPTLLGINLSRIKIASPSYVSGTEPEPHEMPIQLSWGESMNIAFESTVEATVATVEQIGPTYTGLAVIAAILDKLSDDPKYKMVMTASMTTIKYGYGIAVALFNSIENYKRKEKEYIAKKPRMH